VSHRSNSTQENPKHESYPWLEEKVYVRLRQRTVDLVKRSVDVLRKDKQRVSLATVAAKSKELDTEGKGKGISESAILDNQEAREYYEQYRTWRGKARKRAKLLPSSSPALIGVIKAGRDEQRVRQRYLRMSKESLVDRLISTERTLAEQQSRWLGQQDEEFTWRLRAEVAETQLQKFKGKSNE